jgi:8-oxo-dGTP pyrophosphatase MutT (NUDIX family)
LSWIAEVRERLRTPAPSRIEGGEEREAAVLVPLYVDAGELWVLLTRRSDDLRHHRSQVAFPGGKLEGREDAWEAALREAREEVGLEPQAVLRLGELDHVETPTGYRIVPCAGAVPWPTSLRPDEHEIAEVFSVPLTAIANPNLMEQRTIVIDDFERDVTLLHVGRHRIWGVTASILMNLLKRLGYVGAEEE